MVKERLGYGNSLVRRVSGAAGYSPTTHTFTPPPTSPGSIMETGASLLRIAVVLMISRLSRCGIATTNFLSSLMDPRCTQRTPDGRALAGGCMLPLITP